MLRSASMFCGSFFRDGVFRSLGEDIEIVVCDFDCGGRSRADLDRSYEVVRSFNECMVEQQVYIQQVYSRRAGFEDVDYFGEIFSGLKKIDVVGAFWDFARNESRNPETYAVGDFEKIYCKLIADLKNATDILIGDGGGGLGNYRELLEDVVRHFKVYSRPDAPWFIRGLL